MDLASTLGYKKIAQFKKNGSLKGTHIENKRHIFQSITAYYVSCSEQDTLHITLLI